MRVAEAPLLETEYPPGPPPHRRRDVLRTARSVRALVADPLGFVGERFREHGDLYHVDEGGGSHLYVTCDADRIREVLVERAADFCKAGGANDRLVPFLGNGLLTADGESWREQRRLTQPRFHARAITGYARTMVDHAEAVAWTDGERVDVSDAMMRLTLRIVCKALFDHEVRDDADHVAATMDALRHGTAQSLLPDWVPTPTRIAARRAVRRIDALIARLIEERTAGGLRDDLLSMLLDVGLDRRLVRDDVVTLFLAGHETTSHALSWTWWLLATHPDAEARLHQELDDVLGGRAPTVDDVERLPFTAAVASEAMRLFPPAFAVARVAAVDTQLGEYRLAAGSQVLSWIWHCHRSARWFDEPEAFRPERFLAPTFPKHAYLPFGAGTRMCIGAGFAKMELVLVLASLARRWRLIAAPGQTVTPLARVTVSPKGGLPLTVARR
jgi:cytochrome P450